ncbi:hypothetical protein BH10PSE14_BH10PSE14_16950 [soil metagenome]
MTPGGPLNWILAVAMIATAPFCGLARRITFRDGSAIEGDAHPRMFWMFVGLCAIVGMALLIRAALNIG